MADIDPRPLGGQECSSISDKARCIAGGVLEAILYLRQGRDRKNGTEKPEFSLISMLKIRPEKHRLIAVVGAGGKTTLIYELARELKKAGYRAAVTTTTHMYKEGRMDLCLWAMVFPEKSLQAFRRRCRAGCWKRTMWYWWKPTEATGFR